MALVKLNGSPNKPSHEPGKGIGRDKNRSLTEIGWEGSKGDVGGEAMGGITSTL